MRTLAIGFTLALIAAPASAQTTDDRWTPWLGCWDLVLENARDGTVSADTARDQLPRSRPRDTNASQPRVCVERAPGGGATFRTTIGTTQTQIVQTLIADGADHPVSDGDCSGTQRVEWSKDGLRLYSSAELTCKGDPGTRRVSGFALLGPNATWTDVQSIDLGGRDSYRVRRYRRVEDATANARKAGSPLTIDDVKEATGKVTSQAIEAAMVETNASFPLTSRRLLELSDAKVSPNVIDLMVALSYPKRFVVERARADRASTQIIDDPFGLGWAFGQPIWSDAFGFYSPLYGPYSSYYYSPFSYGYLNYSPYFNGGGYFTVIDGDGGGRGPDRPSGLGRVVDGQGYTRVRPRESEPTTSTHSTASTSGSAQGASSSGSSGGSTVTSQGFSSGGSSSSSSGGGDSGGRTAQPR